MLYCYFLWVAMLFKCFTCQCDVTMRSCCFLDRIQWIQCPLWITTKCIQKSPCSFTSVRLLVFVPVSPTFLLTALVKWEKKEKKWRTKVLSHIQAVQSVVMLAQAPSENHLRPPRLPAPWGTERCRQHFVLLQGEAGIPGQFSSDFWKLSLVWG